MEKWCQRLTSELFACTPASCMTPDLFCTRFVYGAEGLLKLRKQLHTCKRVLPFLIPVGAEPMAGGLVQETYQAVVAPEPWYHSFLKTCRMLF
jgi:hypothetical protein